MKLFHKILSAAALLTVVCLAAAETPSPDIQAKKDLQEAKKVYQKNFPASGIVYDCRYIEQALAKYREIQKTPGLSNGMKITVAKEMATALLELERRDEAFTEIQNAMKINGLTETESKSLELFLADCYSKTGNYDKAFPIFDKYKQYEPATKCLAKTKGNDAAIDYMQKNEPAIHKRVSFLISLGERAEAQKCYETALNAGLYDKDENSKMGAIANCVELLLQDKKFEKALDFAQKYKKSIKDAAYYEKVFLKNTTYPLFCRNITFTGKVFDLIAKRNPQGLADNEDKYLDYLFAANQIAKWQEVKGKTEGKAKSVKLQVQEAAILNTMSAAEIANLVKDKNLGEIAAFLAESASTASKYQNEKLARELWTIREKMLAKQEKPSLNCPFMEKGPSDIAGFLALPYTKNPKNIGTLNRKFGSQLQLLLETDASTTTRKISTEKEIAGFTTFTATCDAQGINFFFIMPCTKEKTDGIRLGIQSMGGFEVYLAPGFDAPYHTFIIECPPNANFLDIFMTEYTNPHFIRAMKRNKNVDLSFRVDDNRVMMLLHLDWTVCIDYVPQDGDYWEFEPIHWEQGGLSWGGSQSVHNRSCFGKIIFANMTRENRAAIMRRLLQKAKDIYWRQWSAWQKGYAENFADPELGDPEFYENVLMPLKEKYDGYKNRIKPDMTDDEAIAVYNEAFHFMFNTKAMVEKIRHEYLQKQMTTK